MDDLARRLADPGRLSAAGRLTTGILETVGGSSAMEVSAREFNTGAERYYRTTLRQQQMTEAFDLLHAACRTLDTTAAESGSEFQTALRLILHDRPAGEFMADIRRDTLDERLDLVTLRRLMNLLLLKVRHDEQASAAPEMSGRIWGMMRHQYIERDSGAVVTERLLGDRMVRLLYHRLRENSTVLFNLLTSHWSSHLLAAVNFERSLPDPVAFAARNGIDLSECLDPPARLDTARKLFERRIRYESCRPMPDDPHAVVSPADARVLTGSLREQSLFFLKEKFFPLGSF